MLFATNTFVIFTTVVAVGLSADVGVVAHLGSMHRGKDTLRHGPYLCDISVRRVPGLGDYGPCPHNLQIIEKKTLLLFLVGTLGLLLWYVLTLVLLFCFVTWKIMCFAP